jgi:hypothetical protein
MKIIQIVSLFYLYCNMKQFREEKALFRDCKCLATRSLARITVQSVDKDKRQSSFYLTKTTLVSLTFGSRMVTQSEEVSF